MGESLRVLSDEFRHRESVPRPTHGFETSKGTIRSSTDKPLPTAMVKKLVKAQLAAGV
jgi:hypothetical protein